MSAGWEEVLKHNAAVLALAEQRQAEEAFAAMEVRMTVTTDPTPGPEAYRAALEMTRGTTGIHDRILDLTQRENAERHALLDVLEELVGP